MDFQREDGAIAWYDYARLMISTLLEYELIFNAEIRGLFGTTISIVT